MNPAARINIQMPTPVFRPKMDLKLFIRENTDLNLLSVQLQSKFVVDGAEFDASAGKKLGLFQNHRQSAARNGGSVFAAVKDGRNLRVQPLRNAVSDRPRSRRRKTVRPPRIHEFD